MLVQFLYKSAELCEVDIMSIKSNDLLKMSDFELSEMSMLSGIDNESLLAEMDRNVSTVMDVIDMENNVLLQNKLSEL